MSWQVEHNMPIAEDCCLLIKWLHSTDCEILLDMEVSKSFTSETFYLNCPLLHSLPRFVSRTIFL